MKFFLVLVTLLVGCGDKDTGLECDEGFQECDGDLVVECVDGEWVEQEDCAAEDKVCEDSGDGSADCGYTDSM